MIIEADEQFFQCFASDVLNNTLPGHIQAATLISYFGVLCKHWFQLSQEFENISACSSFFKKSHDELLLARIAVSCFQNLLNTEGGKMAGNSVSSCCIFQIGSFDFFSSVSLLSRISNECHYAAFHMTMCKYLSSCVSGNIPVRPQQEIKDLGTN